MTAISIITATYNAEKTIHDCINSVKNQTASSIEHILVDGKSTDHTISIAERHSHFNHIISEPDNGIYDAMNKGIELASSRIIGILNCDDFYPSNQTLAKVLNTFTDPSIDACYGDLIYVESTDTNRIVRNWKSGSFKPNKFYWGWMPPHPTFFVRRSVYEKYGLFNLELGSAADYEIMLRFLVKHQVKTAYIPEVLVKMRAGGVSNASLKNRLLANKMDRKAWKVNDISPYPWTVPIKPVRKIGQWFCKKSI